MLKLNAVSKYVDGVCFLDDVSLTLNPGEISVLLGPVNAGKTTLLRMIAGLEKPTSGQIQLHDKDLTSLRVQARNVAMVYQDFVNYPTMTVYDNIASPLRIKGWSAARIDTRVREVAGTVGLDHLLNRKPLTLSGGQQQRTALARALAKEADILLLDEPLANLDYKLREEMREELPRLVSGSKSVVVYATAEPLEALVLGTRTAALSEGRVVQFGHAIDLFRAPANVACARAFADPPLNLVGATLGQRRCTLDNGAWGRPPAHMKDLEDGRYQLGVRAHDLTLAPTGPHQIPLDARVELAEITGSKTLIHFAAAGQPWVAAANGIINLTPEQALTAHINLERTLVFDSNGSCMAHP